MVDFFEHQQTARKKTGLLVFYFVLAVVAILALVYIACAFAFLMAERQGHPSRTGLDWTRLWDWQLFGAVSAGTLLLVGGGSAYRIASLASGGHTVAEMLGGRPIDPNTIDLDERKVLNVVEEMAIAAGCPVPPVYLLENETGINAFAAGHSTGDAVIGVTRGCIERLTRDELQGVIAHEFSHILNGDMRLNIRLIGVLYGILLISITGWIIFRTTARSNSYRSRSRDGDKGGNPLPLLGLALYVIGYVGVIFGRLIKAAVSRQREYLADASAVQFTRNPDGIAGALKKIGALQEGSRVRDPEAEEASHLFFGEALGLSEWNPMATHPPLADRIKRIDPSFDGDFSTVSLEPPRSTQLAAEMRRLEEEAAQARREAVSTSRPTRGEKIPFNPVDAITRVGTLNPQNVAYAAALLESIPEPVTALARDPLGATALVYALLIDPRDASVRTQQLEHLARHAEPTVVQEAQRAASIGATLPAEVRLPLIELAVPALKRLSNRQFEQFVANMGKLITADRKVTLFEYALRRLLLRHLAAQFGRTGPPPVRYDSPGPLAEPMAVLLSALAVAGQADPESRDRAYQEGVSGLGWNGAVPRFDESRAGDLNALDNALDELAAAAPPLKKSVLTACARCIGADGQVTIQEAELLRAVADALDCPMPPLQVPA